MGAESTRATGARGRSQALAPAIALALACCAAPDQRDDAAVLADRTTGRRDPAPRADEPDAARTRAPAVQRETAAEPRIHPEAAAELEAARRGGDAAVRAIQTFITESGIDRQDPAWRQKLPKPPPATFDASQRYSWILETGFGPITIELMPQVAPMHVTSTIYLTELGFYDGLTFHRVIPEFMAQGGCPLGNGTGGPGYGYDGEFDPSVVHDRPGLLSMANTGRPNSDGSQFFLTFRPTPWLDGRHTVFGEVVDGAEALRALEARGTRGGQPAEPLRLVKASIRVERR